MSVFNQVPSVDIGRSRFDRSHKCSFTFNGGRLIPWLVEPVLPGDTWEVTTSKLVRMQTLLHPLMDDMWLDTYFFFVPNRLTWLHWPNFCGEANPNAWIQNPSYTIPVVRASLQPVGKVGSVADYMGLPVGTQALGGTFDFNALPFRAYQLVWNDFFRDENLFDPLNVYTGDAAQSLTSLFPTEGEQLYPCLPVCKYRDYFTSALPGVQKGPAVTFALGQTAPLSGSGHVITSPSGHDVNYGLSWTDKNASGNGMRISMVGAGPFAMGTKYDVAAIGGELRSQLPAVNSYGTPGSEVSYSQIAPNNLVVDLSTITANLAAAQSISVNDLRMAFAVQRFYEALARGGSRYTEILQNLFKVRSPDSRLQRPEYLGGNRVHISVNQVVNQAQTASDPLGDLGAYSVTSDKHHDFIYSAVEHGFIIGVSCLRYDHTYSQGCERFWFDKDRFDLYWPQMANLGEQPILNGELYFTGEAADREAFAFQEAWASYRYKPNRVAGELRPGVPNTLASWTLVDYYTSRPRLSSGWMKEDIAPIDRAIAVPSSSAHQFLADFYVQARVTRPMPLYSVPGLIDHH